jgi:guanylate kinase
MEEKHCVVLLGAGASGKDYLRDQLIARFKYKSCVSTTTRPPRPGEVEGTAYHFVSTAQFKRLRATNQLLEWDQFDGFYYAIEAKEFTGQDNMVMILTPHGLEKIQPAILARGFKIYKIFLEVAEPIRRTRLLHHRKYTDEQCQSRLDQDRVKFAHFSTFDLVVRNPEFKVVPCSPPICAPLPFVIV